VLANVEKRSIFVLPISTDMTHTIKTGATITARSIGDWDCIFTAKVLERKGQFATIKIQGAVVRKKVQKDREGNEYVMALGNYSMAPAFK
jgi:hypothetical protein